MQRTKRVLGIEGGGTKTEWILAEVEDEQISIIDRGVLPSSNLALTSDEMLTRIFSVLPRAVTHVGAYLAACGTEEDRARLRRVCRSSWPLAEIAVGSDRDSAIATALGAGDGIVVIAGTGAAVTGRKNGRIDKAGGWGQVVGDRGGGYDLARRGLRQVLTHFDLKQEISPLGQTIMRSLGLNRLADLGTWTMHASKMDVARLAPAVFEAARRGEQEMVDTIREGAEILAEYTAAVARRLEFPNPLVKLFGGIFTHHPDYVSLFTYRLSSLVPEAKVELCEDSGALGAVRLALANEAMSLPKPAEAVAARDLPAEPSREELAKAVTEQSNPRSARMDEMSNQEMVDLFVTEEDQVAKALGACRAELSRAVEVVSESLRDGGRLFYVGAGTSGRLGVLDASEIPPTFSASPELVQGIIAGGVTALTQSVEGAEDHPASGAFAVVDRGVRAGDVVCGIAASGRTPFVLGALAKARELGARTMLLTSNPARIRAERGWDVEIDLPTGPELVTGSTRLKAGTATKVALNIISTCAMVRLGKVRGNAMVDVSISNAKLRDRGIRLVSATLGISYDEAREKLERAEWNVRACLGGDRA